MIAHGPSYLTTLFVVLLIAGCAATPPASSPPAMTIPPALPTGEAENTAPPVKEATPPKVQFLPDQDLLDQGIALLRTEPPEPIQAREAFALLLQRYPQSRWSATAAILIRLINASINAQETAIEAQRLFDQLLVELSRALQEKEHFLKTIQDLKARLRTETAALSREKERLQKDLERLKALEIELEKRERLLR